MPKLDVQTAVLITVLGIVVALIGVVFLILGQLLTGATLVALGLAGGAVGYRACTS